MAMNIANAKTAAIAAAKAQLTLDLVTNQTDDADAALDGIANAIGEAVRVALEEIDNNAVTAVSGEGIN